MNYNTPSVILSLRISGHNANGNNFNAKHINVSVFVALFEYPHIPSEVEYMEYKIEPSIYNSDPKGVCYSLINAVEDALEGKNFDLDDKIAHKTYYKIELKQKH